MAGKREVTADSTARALVTLGEMTGPILEAVVGYKAQVEAAGFSPTEVEVMGVAYHGFLLSMIVAAQS